MANQATDKQINYALSLMDKAGYGTQYMTAAHAQLGAKMRERSGTVQSWLAGMSRVDMSKLIGQLKEEADQREARD